MMPVGTCAWVWGKNHRSTVTRTARPQMLPAIAKGAWGQKGTVGGGGGIHDITCIAYKKLRERVEKTVVLLSVAKVAKGGISLTGGLPYPLASQTGGGGKRNSLLNFLYQVKTHALSRILTYEHATHRGIKIA